MSSEQAVKATKAFLEGSAADWSPDAAGCKGDPYSRIRTWAEDPDLGGLPPYPAGHFADWLSNEWADWAEDPEKTVEQVLSGAVSSWCGGRVMPS